MASTLNKIISHKAVWHLIDARGQVSHQNERGILRLLGREFGIGIWRPLTALGWLEWRYQQDRGAPSELIRCGHWLCDKLMWKLNIFVIALCFQLRICHYVYTMDCAIIAQCLLRCSQLCRAKMVIMEGVESSIDPNETRTYPKNTRVPVFMALSLKIESVCCTCCLLQ